MFTFTNITGFCECTGYPWYDVCMGPVIYAELEWQCSEELQFGLGWITKIQIYRSKGLLKHERGKTIVAWQFDMNIGNKVQNIGEYCIE